MYIVKKNHVINEEIVEDSSPKPKMEKSVWDHREEEEEKGKPILPSEAMHCMYLSMHVKKK